MLTPTDKAVMFLRHGTEYSEGSSGALILLVTITFMIIVELQFNGSSSKSIEVVDHKAIIKF
jgi:hypothetical protein